MKLAHGNSLPELSARSSAEIEIIKNEDGERFISVYSGELTKENLVACITSIKASFPALPVEFYTILSRRVKDSGFCDERLKDAVNHVIDNCIYPTPTIAQFISFDKKKRLYTYSEVVNLVTSSQATFEDFEIIEINGKKFRSMKTELKK